ncbi:hypothetical protein DPMN_081945 [Dreissena polymorpha]|uniref:Uncharacterized protein n=1 Tax=Dreissena polymorpha TaxID=45954 RepID=A0A9D3Y6T0_DREPO|nr:hypothetical protein DPMN_081945 [Dreissena polymorpha]
MPKQNQLSSKGLLKASKCCSHVTDVLVGLVLCIGDAEQSSETFMFKCLYPEFRVNVKRPGLAVVE